MHRPHTALATSHRSSSLNQEAFQISFQVNKNSIDEENMSNQRGTYSQKDNEIQVNKLLFATFLIKLQLTQMGFSQSEIQNKVFILLQKESFEDLQISNIVHWVRKGKNQFVGLLLPSKQKIPENLKKDVDEVEQLQRESQMASDQVESAMNKTRMMNESSQKIMPQLTPLEDDRINNFGELKGKNQFEEKEQTLPFITCSICMEEVDKYLVRKCGHLFCNNCIRSVVMENVENGNFVIQCPEWECQYELESHLVAELLNQQLKNRYLYFHKKTQEENNPENKFCCQPDCGAILTKINDEQLQCPKCLSYSCRVCLQASHAGRDCNDNLQYALETSFSRLEIKKCPACCAPIQKIEGCNHMRCKKCKTEFCWICLKRYSPHHYRIYNCFGCPGMQFDGQQELPCKRTLQLLFFILLPFIVVSFILAVASALPLYMLCMILCKPCQWIEHHSGKCEMLLVEKICCCLPALVRSFLGYFLLLPRSVLFGLLISPFHYFAGVCRILCGQLA